jgi:hypothetical protein
VAGCCECGDEPPASGATDLELEHHRISNWGFHLIIYSMPITMET